MAVDLLFFSLKVSIGRHIVQSTPHTFPSWREAGIQVDKLERMLNKVAAMLSRELDLETPPKKLRKRRGREIQRLDRQSKVVDKFLKQLTIELNLATKLATPKKIRAAVELWMKTLNENLHKSSRMLLPGPRTVVEDVNLPMPKFRGATSRKKKRKKKRKKR
jgi:hypothetical protein